MFYHDTDNFYKNQNAPYVEDIINYYAKMKTELATVFEEVVPIIKDEPRLYVFMVPFDANVEGLSVIDGKCISFDAKYVKIVLGKKLYDIEAVHEPDSVNVTEETYLKKCVEFGEKMPRFPLVQRLGTIPNHTDMGDIIKAVKRCTHNSTISLSENAIFSKWIQYGAMIVFFATDFSNPRYLRYKADVDLVDKEDWDYKYFLDTIIKNFQDRWCDHIYFGLSYSTIEFLTGTTALIQGSANDVLLARGLPDLSVVNRLANIEYEGEFSRGTLEFFRDYNEDGMVYLSKSVSLDQANIKEIRKLLEISTDNISLGVLKNRCCIAGFGVSKKEDVYHITFLGKNSWELSKGGISILRLEKGQYRVPLEPSRDDVIVKLKEKFADFDERVSDIIIAAIKQKHGTIVVVSSAADQETSELTREGRGKRIHKVNLSSLVEKLPNIVTQMCAIDGALMIDSDGNCGGLGLILPNSGGKKGDSTRGARYNSARAYADAHKDSFVCVISEDGMVDFF